ncbi:hypothetical protein BOTBODRAFT_52617 [Botryobasidium botryosum FD-172 SS1]|uniref:Uncharacterized protein n=1 Tax=Botryobasidium botryosum (strain FD-172 SS1) TaxID=930990 RepID=A0A067MSF0_BOTB1|nr:hypothetical protein BOTBODRAFT_52617 [Botryobasidium botryosum FD-172 SS1]
MDGHSGSPMAQAVSLILSDPTSLSSPCSAALNAFENLIPPISRFQFALEAILPVLSSSTHLYPQRILAAYILCALYMPHPIRANPFSPVLENVLAKEKATIIPDEADVDQKEIFIWVLEKIMRDEAKDIAETSPSILVQIPPRALSNGISLQSIVQQTSSSPQNSPSEGRAESILISIAAVSGPDDTAHGSEDPAQDNISRLLVCARRRVLTLSEQRIISAAIPTLEIPYLVHLVPAHFLSDITGLNTSLAYHILVKIFCAKDIEWSSNPEHNNTYNREDVQESYLVALRQLGPTLQCFDLIGKLLATPSLVYASGSSIWRHRHEDLALGDLIFRDVVGGFISRCISILEHEESQEREGLRNEDGCARGVKLLCMFYKSIAGQHRPANTEASSSSMAAQKPAPSIIADSVQSLFDAIDAEMTQFALRFSRYEDALILYQSLVSKSSVRV